MVLYTMIRGNMVSFFLWRYIDSFSLSPCSILIFLSIVFCHVFQFIHLLSLFYNFKWKHDHVSMWYHVFHWCMPCLNESILLFARLLNYFLKRRELKTILFSKILTITNIIITIKKFKWGDQNKQISSLIFSVTSFST
jgi:hypothetical protein